MPEVLNMNTPINYSTQRKCINSINLVLGAALLCCAVPPVTNLCIELCVSRQLIKRAMEESNEKDVKQAIEKYGNQGMGFESTRG